MSEHSANPAVVFRVILGITAVWIAADVLWWATARPAEKVDYGVTLTRLVSEAQPEGRDGWSLCVEAADQARGIDAKVRAEYEATITSHDSAWSRHPHYEHIYTETMPREALQWELRGLRLMEEGGVFDLLADAATCPRMVREVPSDKELLAQLMPGLAPMRLLAKARVATMKMATEDGRYDETVRAFEQTLTLGRACGSQGTIIERLVGSAITGLALSELRYELLETGFDAETCRALRAAMERQLGWPPASLVIEGERAMLLDFVQGYYSDDGHGGGRLDPQVAANLLGGGTGSTALALGGGAFQAGRGEAIELINAMTDGFVLNSTLPPGLRLKQGFDINAFQAGLSKRHTFVLTMVPAIDRFLAGEDNLWTRVEGTRILLALAEHRAVHGDWPATVDELVPAILPEMPLDPACGRPFVYRYSSTGTERLPFLLYSRGDDGVDDFPEADAGDVESTMNFGPSVQTGDVLINTPRPRLEK